MPADDDWKAAQAISSTWKNPNDFLMKSYEFWLHDFDTSARHEKLLKTIADAFKCNEFAHNLWGNNLEPKDMNEDNWMRQSTLGSNGEFLRINYWRNENRKILKSNWIRGRSRDGGRKKEETRPKMRTMKKKKKKGDVWEKENKTQYELCQR